MYVFGLNLPLAEMLLLLVVFFTVAIVYFAVHLRKLEEMTREETGEIQELEKMAEEDKQIETGLQGELERLHGVEAEEEKDITKFEEDVGVLEESAENLYLKKLVPDIYKLQNYVLWALQKGISPDTIKENLSKKGWKDKDLINMVVNDMSDYVVYYKKKKGAVTVPNVKAEGTPGKNMKVEDIPAKEVEAEPEKELPLLPEIREVKSTRVAAKSARKKSMDEEIKKLEAGLKTKRKPARKK